MRRMLIVDDEQDICKTLSRFFGTKDFAVTTAFSGEEALSRLREGPIDALLLDILLPGIHGLEVLQAARKLHPSARIIVMSGLADERLIEQARTGGATAFVKKPFDCSDATWAAVLS